MKTVCFLAFLLTVGASPASSQEAPGVSFRRGNENAAGNRWDQAIAEYTRLDSENVRAPSLYWNWAQATLASGRKGEALWAFLRAQDLQPSDPVIAREIERLRSELGLDPSEISLGLIGDTRRAARRYRFDALAGAAFLASFAALSQKKALRTTARGFFLIGLLLLSPFLLASFSQARAVVVQRDAPLVDTPRSDATALANLREGEVVPILGEEGEYARIQDASGARGFAHKTDVRRIGTN